MSFLKPKRRKIKKVEPHATSPNTWVTLTLSCGHKVSQGKFKYGTKEEWKVGSTIRCRECEDPHTYYRTSY